MTIVNITTGKPIDKAPDEPNLVTSLKDLIELIENGTLAVERFYLIADCGDKTHSFDNGLTATEGVMMLEQEKFHILCALRGDKL